MLWINEVEMVDSVDEFKNPRDQLLQRIFQLSRCWTWRFLLLQTRSSRIPTFKKVSLEAQKGSQERGPVLRGRRIAFMIYDLFRLPGAHDEVLDFADLFSLVIRDYHIQEFGTGWDIILLSISKIPSDDVFWKSVQKENTWVRATTNQAVEILRQGDSSDDVEQKLRLRNFDAGQEKNEMTRGRSEPRKGSVRGRNQTRRIIWQLCRCFLKGICTRTSCECWHPPECQFFKKKKRIWM